MSDAPADAPVQNFQNLLAQRGTFASFEAQRVEDRKRAGRIPPESQGAVQYRLCDGRVIEADTALYDLD